MMRFSPAQLIFSRFARCFLALSLILGLMPRAEARSGLEAVPSDLDAVDIYLHTVDVGNLIFNNFGHTALRVHDKSSGRDLVFNWGIFDFGDPLSFSLRFYQGHLVYNLGIYPYSSTLRAYLHEERTVWEDRLNLSREEKAKLLERLVWNSRSENRPYDYQYFYDNCSTRPRDYIDEALGGKLKQQTASTITSQTFRSMMYEGYAFNPGMDVLLDIGMNSRLDHLLNVWDKMFHPIALRQALLDSQGAAGPLVAESKIIAQYQGPTAYLDLGYLLILLVMGLPLCLLGLGFFALRPAPAWLLRIFALIALPLVGFGALVGFLMPLSWAVSNHLDLHHNANQFIFWPFDFVYILILLFNLWTGRALQLGAGLWRAFWTYSVAHMIISMVLPVLRALDLVVQNVDRPLVYVLPPYLVIIFLLWRVGVQKKESSAWKDPAPSQGARAKAAS